MDITIDIETLGLGSDAVVMAVAAVAFNPETGEEAAHKVWLLDIGEQLAAGRKIEAGTLRFWAEQDSALFQEMLSGKASVASLLPALQGFVGDYGQPNIWMRGTDFDNRLLSSLLAPFPGEPWRFFQLRDCRTLEKSLNIETSADNLHDPLSDCRRNISGVVRASAFTLTADEDHF